MSDIWPGQDSSNLIASRDLLTFFRNNGLWLGIKASTDPSAVALRDLMSERQVDLGAPYVVATLNGAIDAKLLEQRHVDYLTSEPITVAAVQAVRSAQVKA